MKGMGTVQIVQSSMRSSPIFRGYLGSSTFILALEGKAGQFSALGFAYIYIYM